MNKRFISYNMTEQMVDYKLNELIEQSKMCKCERCCADVRALALNTLPPKYVVTRIGEAMTKFDLLGIQKQTNITTAIMIAIEKVSRNPRHEDETLGST